MIMSATRSPSRNNRLQKLILIVVDGFPQLSETFVLNHIVSLKKLGYRTHIMANRKIDEPHHALVSEYRLLEETTFRSRIPLNRVERLFSFVNHAVKVFLRNPRAVFDSLNKSKYGKAAVNGELIISVSAYLRIQKPDFIHCHFGPNGVLTEKIISVLKWDVPLFTSFHGYDTIASNLGNTDYGRLFKNAKGLFANSKFLKEKIIELGCDSNKISIVPVGVLDKQIKRNHYITRSDELIFVTVGRLVKVKGIGYALRAFKLFKEERPEAAFHYIIIGDGEMRRELESLTRESALQGHVSFTGALTSDGVGEYLSKASVFILTGITVQEGRAETQGLVYQEAATFGMPLIASDAGGVAEYVINNETGLIAKEKDIQDIKEKIERLYFNPDLRDRMGKAARDYALENFDQMKLTAKMIKNYESYKENQKKD